MNLNTLLEIISVIFGILYLLLMIRENIWCWIFGILASAITVYLYVHVTLYLEAGLNIYYILAGFYGWIYWYQNKKTIDGKNHVPIHTWRSNNHIAAIILSGILSIILGIIMHRYTNSERPYIDATITTFSFVATYMEAKKVLSTWHYWFLLNGASVFLQIDRGLYFFSVLSVFYTIMSIYGFKQWKKTYTSQNV